MTFHRGNQTFSYKKSNWFHPRMGGGGRAETQQLLSTYPQILTGKSGQKYSSTALLLLCGRS